MFAGLVHDRLRRVVADEVASEGPSLSQRLAALAVNKRAQVVRELVRREASIVLNLGRDATLDVKQALQEHGLDSLMAVELRNRLEAATGLRFTATFLYDYPTIAGVTDYVLSNLQVEDQVEESETIHVEAVEHGDRDEPIAIVSMSCRLPGGVDNPHDLWRLLEAGGDAITSFPNDRGWDIDAIYDPDMSGPGRSYTRSGGFLRQVDEFDAALFGITPREAEAIDPQQRMLLESAWEAIEAAGIPPDSLERSRTAVLTGLIYDTYRSIMPAATVAEDGYGSLGTAFSIASGRIAYTLGLEGPALSIDTACSMGLVGVHLACQMLRKGEVDLALVDGASLFLTPEPFITFSHLRALSPDGRCKAFSDHADGAGWSEGVATLVLERLRDAEAKGHPILAVVRGSAINQDGRSQGLTAPNGPSQQRLISRRIGQRPAVCRRCRHRRGSRHGHGPRRSDRGPGSVCDLRP